MTGVAGLLVDGVLGLPPGLMVDVGILGTMEESVMLLPTRLAGCIRLTSKVFRAISSIMISLPIQAKGVPFHLLNKGNSFLNTCIFECFAG